MTSRLGGVEHHYRQGVQEGGKRVREREGEKERGGERQREIINASMCAKNVCIK